MTKLSDCPQKVEFPKIAGFSKKKVATINDFRDVVNCLAIKKINKALPISARIGGIL